MCTLALAWRVFADAPVALAANRDERFERPSEPPMVRSGDPAIVAPRDGEAGGTWIGLAETGLAVAITNRWLDDDREGDRSRGRLVWDCLRTGSAESAVRSVERELNDRVYAGFNLVVADDVAAFLLSYDGQLGVTRLDPGVHVVGNVGGVVNGGERFSIPSRRAEAGAARVDSVRRIASTLTPEPGTTATDWLDHASDVLADHEYGACLHGDEFGTRSFTRIRTGDSPTLRFADGPPCETSPESVPLPAEFTGRSDERSDGPESQL